MRSPQDDLPQGAAPRNLVGGTFNPGIASLHGRDDLREQRVARDRGVGRRLLRASAAFLARTTVSSE